MVSFTPSVVFGVPKAAAQAAWLSLSSGPTWCLQCRVAKGGTLIYLEERFPLVEVPIIETPFRLRGIAELATS